MCVCFAVVNAVAGVLTKCVAFPLLQRQVAEKQKQWEKERERKIRDKVATSGQNDAEKQAERPRSPLGESREKVRDREVRDLVKERTRDGRARSPRRERDRPSPQRYVSA